jgi:hypothetical protein
MCVFMMDHVSMLCAQVSGASGRALKLMLMLVALLLK